MDGRAISTRLQKLRAPLVPGRVRSLKGQSFSYLPHRFLHDGFLSFLAGDELHLYVFLLLAGNRQGVSFYGVDAICTVLRIPLERYRQARNALIAKDLIAFACWCVCPQVPEGEGPWAEIAEYGAGTRRRLRAWSRSCGRTTDCPSSRPAHWLGA
jgi:hypothetical protein